jgi:hypothetical protein
MNKELQEIIDEVYHRYCISQEILMELDIHNELLTQEEFINKCKTNPEFSEKWELKIEERELSNDERFRIAYKNLELRKKLEAQSKMLHYPDGHNKVMDDANIPTKLITITYNNKTIESYE